MNSLGINKKKIKENHNSLFILSQLLIALAGFLLLISTVLFVQEKEFGFKATEESIKKNIAEREMKDVYTVTFNGRTLFEQSEYYAKLKFITFFLAIFLIDVSFIWWILGNVK